MSFFKRYSRIIGNGMRTASGTTKAETGTPGFKARTMPYLFRSRQFGQSSIRSTNEPQTGKTVVPAVIRAWSSPLFRRG